MKVRNTGGTAGGETYWGNPKVTQTYIDGLAYMGFKSLRIPRAWSCYTSGDDYAIEGIMTGAKNASFSCK